MIKYLNTKKYGQVETVDQVDSNDYENHKAFRQAVRYLLNEYNLAFNGGVYVSNRSTKEYREA